MSEEVVKYSLTLNDLLSGKLREADQEAKKLHGHLGDAKTKLLEIGGAVAAAFSFAAMGEFAHKSGEVFETLEQANAQLKAGLESTRNAAGLTFGALEESQNSLRKKVDYSRASIADMQAQLLTFPKVTKDTFDTASAAIMDMATRTHHGLSETAIMVGKALQDPIHGITALRRVGVNFNKTQTDVVKHMVATGHAAQAQAYILRELNTEFGGSAEAAAKAHPHVSQYNRSLESLQLTVGNLTMKLKEHLAPAMEKVVSGVQTAIQWMHRHKTIVEAGAIVVGILAAALLAYEVRVWSVTAAHKVATIATEIWAGVTRVATGVQWLWNAAMTANPIGLVIVAIGAATAAVVYCYKHFAKFRAVLMGVWETIKEFGRIVADIFGGLWHVIHGVFTFSATEIKQGLGQQMSAMGDAGARLGGAFKKGFDEGMSDFAKDHADDTAKIAGPKKIGAKGMIKGDAGGTGLSGETAKSTGNKSTSIVININGGLVHSITNNVKNIQEGTQKIKELVTQALLSAVNDSQITAGQ